MGHPCDRTVQDILVSNERRDAKSQLVIELLIDDDFPNLMGGCNLVWEFEG